jgi:GTP-binding protein
MLIKRAEFIKSSAKTENCPPPDFPEYAFTGRSNVGKSSLINMLTGKKKLAKTSSTPGKTRLINHFLINKEWYLVDLPGYGYARAPERMRKEYALIIKHYIQKRENMVCLFLLIDIRHAPIPADLLFMQSLGENQVPFVIVFTKSDKLSTLNLEKNLGTYLDKLRETWEPLPAYYLTSALKSSGKEELLGFINETNNRLRNEGA